MQAAKSGAEATIKMKAKAGRASYVNISQLTQRDPGAEAVAVWLEAIYDKLSGAVQSYPVNMHLMATFSTY